MHEKSHNVKILAMQLKGWETKIFESGQEREAVDTATKNDFDKRTHQMEINQKARPSSTHRFLITLSGRKKRASGNDDNGCLLQLASLAADTVLIHRNVIDSTSTCCFID